MASPLDYESKQTYTLKLQATDSKTGYSAQAVIQVQVKVIKSAKF